MTSCASENISCFNVIYHVYWNSKDTSNLNIESSLTYFWKMVQFYTPLKTLENQRFSGVFRGYKMGTLAGNGLKLRLFTNSYPANTQYKCSWTKTFPFFYRAIVLFQADSSFPLSSTGYLFWESKCTLRQERNNSYNVGIFLSFNQFTSLWLSLWYNILFKFWNGMLLNGL